MGNPKDPASTSLERLKNLDALPNLAVKLEEAKQLCTHAARADMVAKWLLEKLKTSDEAQWNPESWECLLTTLRLLSPDRVATLLVQHDFLGTVKIVLEDDELPDSPDSKAVLLGLMNTLQFLLEVSKGPHGAQIKAALRLSAPFAASLLGDWLRSFTLFFESNDWNDSDTAMASLLRPAFDIWELRKHSSEENSLFAEHCIAPVSSWLAQTALPDNYQSLKRKRTDESLESEQDFVQTLESSIARHIFLPSRQHFFRSQQEINDTGGKSQAEPTEATSMLEQMLEPLKSLLSQQAGDDTNADVVLPQLLDIAFRCAPAPNPRQRMKEQPWIEALFQSLLACNELGLVQLLSVVKKHGSLTRETLETLVKLHSGLGSSPPKKIDWELIARVVALDADVFTNHQLAETLFSDLTSRIVEYGKAPGSLGIDWYPDIAGSGVQLLWKDGIVVPVMEAFAKRRDLKTFIDMWAKQLRTDQHNDIWSVWTKLDESFKPLVEESLMQSQIVELVTRLCSDIIAASKPNSFDSMPADQAAVYSGAVILRAVLDGVQREDLLAELRQPLGGFFESPATLSQVCGSISIGTLVSKTRQFHERSGWALITKMFEIWFPLWAARQSDSGAIADKGLQLLSSGAQYALKVSMSIRPDSQGKRLIGVACDAECFVASLCSVFHAYQDGRPEFCSFVCTQKANDLVNFLDGSNFDVVVRYPDVLTIVGNGNCRGFFSRCFDDVVLRATPLSSTTLQALVGAVVRNARADVMDALLRASNPFFDGDPAKYNAESVSPEREAVILETLSAVPTQLLSRQQRETFVNTACHLQGSSKGQEPNSQRDRLAVLIKLMELPNATSILSTDPAELWNFARSVTAADPVEELKSLTFLEALVKQVVGHLLATQEQERSRSMLVSFSKEVKKQIKLICQRKQLDDGGWILVMIKAIVEKLESEAKAELKTDLAHQKPALVTDFVKVCLELVTKSIVKNNRNPIGIVKAKWLQPAIDVLLVLPDSLLHIEELKANSSLESMVDTLISSAARFADGSTIPSNNTPREIEAFKAILVACYELLCRYMLPRDYIQFTNLATRLLELSSQPTEHEALLRAFERYINRLDVSVRFQVLYGLISNDGEVTASSMSLAKVCIAKLDNTGNDGNHTSSPHTLAPRLLNLATESNDILVTKRAIDCLLIVFKQKTFLVNQYTIESTLTAILKLLRGSLATRLYLDICGIVSILLLQHRSRLRGRFHLVINIFQELISRLFQSTKTRAPSAIEQIKPTVKHAQQLARLLTIFCEPPQTRRQTDGTALVDESRKEQATAGQYVQFILHHYCIQVLHGTLAEGMREALTPGLWSTIEAIEMNDAEGIRSLSAAMNNSERAMLRSVYEDWRRFGKWRGS